MPEYLYKCGSCGKEFTVVLSWKEREQKERRKEIRCPECESKEVRHLVEPFFAKTSRKS